MNSASQLLNQLWTSSTLNEETRVIGSFFKGNLYQKKGELQEAHLDGMMSRICQHEYDHIIGRNFVEHVSKFKLKRAEEKAKKLIKQYSKA